MDHLQVICYGGERRSKKGLDFLDDANPGHLQRDPENAPADSGASRSQTWSNVDRGYYECEGLRKVSSIEDEVFGGLCYSVMAHYGLIIPGSRLRGYLVPDFFNSLAPYQNPSHCLTSVSCKFKFQITSISSGYRNHFLAQRRP